MSQGQPSYGERTDRLRWLVQFVAHYQPIGLASGDGKVIDPIDAHADDDTRSARENAIVDVMQAIGRIARES